MHMKTSITTPPSSPPFFLSERKRRKCLETFWRLPARRSERKMRFKAGDNIRENLCSEEGRDEEGWKKIRGMERSFVGILIPSLPQLLPVYILPLHPHSFSTLFLCSLCSYLSFFLSICPLFTLLVNRLPVNYPPCQFFLLS